LEITALLGAQAIKINQPIELIKGDHPVAETGNRGTAHIDLGQAENQKCSR
jgi:hypothetical protein